MLNITHNWMELEAGCQVGLALLPSLAKAEFQNEDKSNVNFLQIFSIRLERFICSTKGYSFSAYFIHHGSVLVILRGSKWQLLPSLQLARRNFLSLWQQQVLNLDFLSVLVLFFMRLFRQLINKSD